MREHKEQGGNEEQEWIQSFKLWEITGEKYQVNFKNMHTLNTKGIHGIDNCSLQSNDFSGHQNFLLPKDDHGRRFGESDRME